MSVCVDDANNKASPGTLHFRTTCLVPGTEDYINTIEKFHQEFMDRYRD